MPSAYVTAAGIGAFLLLWAWLRGGLFTLLLATFGVVLVGSGVIGKVAHGVTSVVAVVLNGLGGAL